MSHPPDLIELAAASPALAGKVEQIRLGQTPVLFSHVTESAHGFLAALLARRLERTLWIVCANVRSQELLFETLINWKPDALFLPEAEFAAVETVLPDPEITAERLALLGRLEKEKSPQLVVATAASLDQAAPKPGTLKAASLTLRRQTRQEMEQVLARLADAGYERVAQVTTRGQFAVRGGILDLFSWQTAVPLRIEFLDDEIESLREFDVDAQTALRNLQSAEVLLGGSDDHRGRVRDYIAPSHLVVAVETEAVEAAPIRISEGWLEGEDGPEDFAGAFQDCAVGDFAVGEFLLAEAKRADFCARLRDWREEGATVVIYFQTEGEIERFREIFETGKDDLQGAVLSEGSLARRFCLPDAGLVVLSGAELFGRSPAHGRRRLQRAERLGRNRAQIDFSELNEGDHVVHLEHGIGRFLQLTKMPAAGGAEQEVLVLEFAEEARLYVPLEQAYLVSRYVGVGKKSPPLSSLADAKWAKAKKNAAAAIFDYAGKMLAVQAERETEAGYTFGPDTKWQEEFEHSFLFRETPDQLKAIAETKRDMESTRRWTG